MNIDEIITICGFQIQCRGDRAVGELLFETSEEFGGEYGIPICEKCHEELTRLDMAASMGSTPEELDALVDKYVAKDQTLTERDIERGREIWEALQE